MLALAGLFVLLWRLAAGHRQIAASLLVMTAMQIYVAGSVESWTVAGAFGQRRFVALTAGSHRRARGAADATAASGRLCPC